MLFSILRMDSWILRTSFSYFPLQNCSSCILNWVIDFFAFSHCSMQCEDPRCQIWQHFGCVIISEKPMEGNPAVPDFFYCELCRLKRADPYVSPLFVCLCLRPCASKLCDHFIIDDQSSYWLQFGYWLKFNAMI